MEAEVFWNSINSVAVNDLLTLTTINYYYLKPTFLQPILRLGSLTY